MSRFELHFYNARSGVCFSMHWPDREKYLAARAFLDELTGGAAVGETEEDDMYVLETKEQRDALFTFQREMMKAAKGR
jgi:hypothetical protein